MIEKECIGYFKKNRGFHRLLEGMRDKYQSLGSFGGTIQLDHLTKEEKDALSGLFRKDYYHKKSVGIKADQVLKALEDTKFQGVNMETVIQEYFGSELLSKKEMRNQLEIQREEFFQGILDAFPGTRAHQWLKSLLRDKTNAYRIILHKYEQDRDALRKVLMMVMEALDMLSFSSSKPMRLALFSSTISKNPHTFDLDSDCGILLLYGIVHQLALPFPKNAEAKVEALYQAGLIQDEISNYTIISGILAYQKGMIHEGWKGFYNRGEPLQVSLWNLSEIEVVECPLERVFLFENPTVFSEVLSSLRHIRPSLICTYGQIKLASLILLDKLAPQVKAIYYSGDVDPEGLGIADRLKVRYGDKLVLWRYTISDYEMVKSHKRIEHSRMKKLDQLKSPQLQELAAHMRKEGYGAYQELLTEAYIQDMVALLEKK